jgi:hypothetical protein
VVYVTPGCFAHPKSRASCRALGWAQTRTYLTEQPEVRNNGSISSGSNAKARRTQSDNTWVAQALMATGRSEEAIYVHIQSVIIRLFLAEEESRLA